jgi:putative SOS response-associated peptidase YedK
MKWCGPSTSNAGDPLARRRKNNGLTHFDAFAKAKSVLKPYPDELMDAHDVSPIVNSANYDGPECIEPVSDDEMPGGG